MRQYGDRTIKVKKEELIQTIKDNKEAHELNYEEAVIAYKKEAANQLAAQSEELKNGSLKIKLNLVTPINNSVEYDKVAKMFEMEVEDEVELSLQEFNQYIHDETEHSKQAFMSNSMYIGG